jgi:hypothetical protein
VRHSSAKGTGKKYTVVCGKQHLHVVGRIFQEMGIHVGAHEEGNSRNRNFQVSDKKKTPLYIAPLIGAFIFVYRRTYIYIYLHLFTTVLSLPNFQRLHVSNVWGKDVERETLSSPATRG